MAALLLAAGSGVALGQPAYKCKNAAGIIEYSDKPCAPAHDEVAWRPKYSTAATKMALPKNENANKPDDESKLHRAPPRKSAYTRWLDSKDEASAPTPAQK